MNGRWRALGMVVVVTLLALGGVGAAWAQGPTGQQDGPPPERVQQQRAPAACPPDIQWGCVLSGSTSPGLTLNSSATANNSYSLYASLSSPGNGSAAVWGRVLGTGSSGYGVYGSHQGSGYGVYGFSNNGIGFLGFSNTGTGMQGETFNTGDKPGILGQHRATTGTGAGVEGRTNSTANSPGVLGIHSATSGTGAGVEGRTNSTSDLANGVLGVINSTSPGGLSAAVRGENKGMGTLGIGVWGSHAGGGYGVYGATFSGSGVHATALSGYGVRGTSNSGVGVLGRHLDNSGTAAGVEGRTSSTSVNAVGVLGVLDSTSPGVFSAAVRGQNNGTNGGGMGVYGSSGSTGWGVFGSSASGLGVYGFTDAGTGVLGESSGGSGYGGSFLNNATTGTPIGVRGVVSNTQGVAGYFLNSADPGSESGVAVQGFSAGGSEAKVHPEGFFYDAAGEFAGLNGVIGAATTSDGYGVMGLADNEEGTGIYGENTAGGNAGYFYGNVHVTGNLTVSGSFPQLAGTTRLDHPLDPENQTLSHAFVESPEMKTVYDGNVTLDANGEAVVEMPTYFQALNRDFRYQLTTIGGFAPVYIAQEIENNRFQIAGGTAGMKVSWEVTGIRQDPWANDHRVQVEEAKPENERGTYLYPAGYGQPESRGAQRGPGGQQQPGLNPPAPLRQDEPLDRSQQ